MNLRIVSSLLCTCLIAACGSKEQPDFAQGATARRPAASGNATAEEVAAESRGDLDCPADIETPPRGAGGPVDDVVGVRPGLTFNEAANVVLCTGELLVIQPGGTGFNINTYGATLRQGFSARNAEARVVKSSQDYMREMSEDFAVRSGNAVRQDMHPGEAKWFVSTMGLPGEERVISAAREEWFAEGRNPTLESVADALVRKYGTPTRKQVMPQMIYLTWVHDPQGRFVPETAPLASRCNASPDPDGGANFSPDCGIVVAALVQPLRENPALAQFFQVGVTDHAGGYEAITRTEQALEAGEMQRRAQQVQDASRNADQPKL